MGEESTYLKVRIGKRFTITIPKEAREKLDIKEGDVLDAIITTDSITLKKSKTLMEFIESLKPRGTIKEFLKMREEEAAEEDDRIKELTKKPNY